MAVTAIQSTDALNELYNSLSTAKVNTDNGNAFDNLLSSAIQMYKEADAYQNAAEESEMNFALGYSTSTHDLAIAQQKANISLQYTTRVTNKAIEAYKELMQIQI